MWETFPIRILRGDGGIKAMALNGSSFYFTILCYAVLCCAVLCCAMLYYMSPLRMYKAPPKRELSAEDRIVENMGGEVA